LIPALKYNPFGFAELFPNSTAQSPLFTIGLPLELSSVPKKAPVLGLKALISPLPKFLPVDRHRNRRNSPAAELCWTISDQRRGSSEFASRQSAGGDQYRWGVQQFGAVASEVTVSAAGNYRRAAYLHSFKGQDGKEPAAGIVAGKKGALYGKTSLEGTSGNAPYLL